MLSSEGVRTGRGDGEKAALLGLEKRGPDCVRCHRDYDLSPKCRYETVPI